jgi:hypothetical protein
MASDSDDDEITIVERPAQPTVLESSRKRSPVWALFTIKDISNKDWVTCDVCQTQVKTKDSGTSNLYGHLKSHHPIRYAEIVKVSKPKPKASTRSSSQPTITQLYEAKSKYLKDSERHKVLTECITRFLISGKNLSTVSFSYMLWWIFFYSRCKTLLFRVLTIT